MHWLKVTVGKIGSHLQSQKQTLSAANSNSVDCDNRQLENPVSISHCVSLHPGVWKGTGKCNAGGSPTMD